MDNNKKDSLFDKISVTWSKFRNIKFSDRIQIGIGLISCFAVIMSFLTLMEMKTERNNAYKPEIVIVPSIFKGGQVETEELEIDKDYLFIGYGDASPSSWIRGNTLVDNKYNHISDDVRETSDKEGLLFLEIPYLSLKNIGQGTAKDIKVTFSTNWMEYIFLDLNSKKDYDCFTYYSVDVGNNEYRVMRTPYENRAEDLTAGLTTIDFSPISITYLAPGDDLIKIAFPQGWYDLLSILFGHQMFEHMENENERSISVEKRINVTIEYKDLQGKKHKQTETVPWKYSTRSKKSSLSEEGKSSIYLWTSFYSGFSR